MLWKPSFGLGIITLVWVILFWFVSVMIAADERAGKPLDMVKIMFVVFIIATLICIHADPHTRKAIGYINLGIAIMVFPVLVAALIIGMRDVIDIVLPIFAVAGATAFFIFHYEGPVVKKPRPRFREPFKP